MFRHFLHRPLAIDSPSFIHGGMFLSPIGAGLVYEFQSRDGGITWEEVRLILPLIRARLLHSGMHLLSMAMLP